LSQNLIFKRERTLSGKIPHPPDLIRIYQTAHLLRLIHVQITVASQQLSRSQEGVPQKVYV